MSRLSAKFGYVVEADSPGYFYDRSGQWSKYGSAAEAFVWSENEAAAIRQLAADAEQKWPTKPALAHPAVYDDSLGLTVITGDALPIASIAPPSQQEMVPNSGGKMYDVKVGATKLGVNMLGGASHSL